MTKTETQEQLPREKYVDMEPTTLTLVAPDNQPVPTPSPFEHIEWELETLEEEFDELIASLTYLRDNVVPSLRRRIDETKKRSTANP